MKEIEIKELDNTKYHIENMITDALKDVGLLDQKVEESIEEATKYYTNTYLTEFTNSLKYMDNSGIKIQSIAEQILNVHFNALNDKYTDTLVLYLSDVFGSILSEDYLSYIKSFNLYNFDIFSIEFYDELIEIKDKELEINNICELFANAVLSKFSASFSLSTRDEDGNVIVSPNDMDLIDHILFISIDFVKDLTKLSIESCLDFYKLVYGI